MEEAMLTQLFAVTLIGAALLATPSLAQTSAPTSGPFMTQMQPGQWRLSSFKGLNVYNEANEKVGDINEVILSRDGRATAAVIGVGGFLGVGEHSVAVPFDQIRFMDQPRATAATTSTNPAPSTGMPAPTGRTAPAGAPDVTTTGSTATAGRDAFRLGPDHAVLNMTREQLKAAPEFKADR
jgi:sporulation protein YlmC with PRC-barrel domain